MFLLFFIPESVFDLVPEKDKQNIDLIKKVHHEAAQMTEELQNKIRKKEDVVTTTGPPKTLGMLNASLHYRHLHE